ncbi:YncE family protein [Herbihabitans rhizosphaerae]|uniref:YncE family protein n=1 Tax=Herbihabitans rhizosphaerae TaxID=1872711 RepID=UPI001F5F2E75|nr:hypothetical protein [Herbihabitans rhizosphaerae]
MRTALLRIIGMLALAILATASVTACSKEDQPTDELMVTDNPVAATPATSPAPAVTPAGAVVSAPAASSVVVDPRSRLIAVAAAAPPAVLLYRLDDLAAPAVSVPLAGPAESLTLVREGGPVLASVSSSKQLISVRLPDGAATTVTLPAAPVAATPVGAATLVALREHKSVAVVEGDKVVRVISGGLFSSDVPFAMGDRGAVLDRVRNAIFEVDLKQGTIGAGLRAGEGSTNGVLDRFGRVLTTDTRGGALLAFSFDPLLMRQRYPVPGAPYGIAYDAKRDLAWVTLTARNEVVGFHVAGDEPRERYRLPTVGQPNSVAVDQESGRVIVASASGGGVQVMQP